MSESISYYDSTETGATVLNQVASSLIDVIDSCVRTGYNQKSITSITVAAGVATAACTAHGYSGVYSKDVQVDGCAEPTLNGKKQLLSVATNTFTFAAVGVADGAYGGTISAKRAPLGWTKPYTGTGKAIFKRSDPAATLQMLRIVDTAVAPASTTTARVTMVESATDVDTYTGQAPTEVQMASGQYWNKGQANATPKAWALVGDSRAFFLFVQSTASTVLMLPYFFGDAVSYRAADAYGCVLSGNAFDNPVAFGNGGIGFVQTQQAGPNSSQLVVSRAASQLGGSVRACVRALGTNDVIGGSSFPVYPSAVDNGAVVHRPIFFAEEHAAFKHPIRGEIPGLAQPLAEMPFPHLSVVDGFTGFAGKFLAVNIAGSQNGQALIDLTGPWR